MEDNLIKEEKKETDWDKYAKELADHTNGIIPESDETLSEKDDRERKLLDKLIYGDTIPFPKVPGKPGWEQAIKQVALA